MREWLLEHQNADGGWPYAPGKRSTLEPTALAFAALLGHAPAESARARARTWILDRQLPDGGFAARTGEVSPHWATPLAAIALCRGGLDADVRERALTWLRTSSGRQIASDSATNDLDGSLRGWSWFPGTFSWVEPTAYAILAFKTEGWGTDPRVVEGEKLLFDRVCAHGGWNYGNRRVLGEELVPFDQVTAKVLLALQDRRDRAELTPSAESLFAVDLQDFQSTVTRAWVFLARAAWGRTVGERERSALGKNLALDEEMGTVTLSYAMAAIAAAWPESKPFAFA